MRKFLCLIVCLSLLLCTSCGNSSQTNTDQNNNANACSYVDFSVEPFDTTVNAGEKKTFKASLTNISGEELELFHGVYLITFYVHTEKQPKTFVTTSLGITTNMAIDETIDKEVNFNFETVGTYYLHAEYSFSIDGEEYYYAIDPIEITVVE